MTETYDQLYKIILAGDATVGKTNLVHKFVKGVDQASKNISPTIGVEFATKTVKLTDGKKIKAQIWDTGTALFNLSRPGTISFHNDGVESYNKHSHYRRAFGALVVYDITKEKTFQSLRKWIENIREQADQNVVIFIIGNKTDLRDQQVITQAEGKKLARDLNVGFAQTSALTNDNVENTFMSLLEEIQKKKKQEGSYDRINQGFPKEQKTMSDEKCQC